jgi:pyruvate carboxylase
MKSGSARVFEHQIPGGQYSNLLVQCQSMGLWSRWEEVLDAYRDVNELFGDIVKVTPSSKCVGDLALYLVTRNVKAADIKDPVKASAIDFPESVIGLMKGDLGFPHRGFPAAIEASILKGESKRTIRAGLTLPSEDFDANCVALSAKHKCVISKEEGMSSLMYPKVFDDFMKAKSKKGPLLRYLPTTVYLYGMTPGASFSMQIPPDIAQGQLGNVDPQMCTEGQFGIVVTVAMERIGPLKDRHRSVVFRVEGKEQHVLVKDTSGAFVFEGEMASTSDIGHVASPMPGVVETVLVTVGSVIKAGDTLCTIGAMKMTVKVTALTDGKIESIIAPVGTRVIEGALIIVIKK